MSYIKKTLSPDEEIIIFERLHWIVFFRPVCFIIALLGGGGWIVQSQWINNQFSFIAEIIMLSAAQEEIFNIAHIYASRIAYILIGAALLISIKAAIKYFSTEAAATTKRVIFKTGFIRIVTLELRKEKIENIQVDQSILGRILGYGDLTFIGTGGSPVVFQMIRNPVDTKKQIDNQLFK